MTKPGLPKVKLTIWVKPETAVVLRMLTSDLRRPLGGVVEAAVNLSVSQSYAARSKEPSRY